MLLSYVIRTRFRLTSRGRADSQIVKESKLSTDLVKSVTPELAARSIKVPAMIGVDPEMREWSLLQTLEHNVIVNRSITRIIESLASEIPYVSEIDPKTDVLPSDGPSIEQVEAFEQSISEHIQIVAKFKSLKSNERFDHPIFGSFDAHAWHCMFGFHLMLHRRQMAKAVSLLT